MNLTGLTGFSFSALGGIREIRHDIRELRPGARRRGRSASTAVAEYTGLWGWPVVPGAHVVAGGGRTACSCGAGDCRRPGAHPLPEAAAVPAGATLDDAVRAWARTPDASLLLPVGVAFDVVEVAETTARRAVVRLERMGLPLGPVALTPLGRAWFLVARGSAAELPDLLYRMGWDDAALDLAALAPGDHITAPPSELGGHGPVTWLRPPSLVRAGSLPPARLLLGPLAYVQR